MRLGDPVFLTPTITDSVGRLVVIGGQYATVPVDPTLLPAVDGKVESGKTYVGYPLAGTSYYFEAINAAGQTAGQTIHPLVSNINVSVVPPVASALTGGAVIFASTVDGAVDKRTTWTVEGLGSVDPDGRYVAPDTPGTYKVWAASVADPTRSAYSLVAVRRVGLGVTPHTISLHPGWQTDVRADVVGTTLRDVTWSATAGALNGSGNLVTFVAPDQDGDYLVRATSVDDPRVYDEMKVTVLPAPTAVLTADQESIPRGGSTTLRASASGGSAQIDNGVGALSGGSEVFTVSPTATTTYTMTTTSPLGAKATARVTVAVQGLSMSVSPAVATLSVSGGTCTGSTLDFSALVTGASDPSVTWSCTGGTIDNQGHYVAPAVPGDYRVVATSNFDPSKAAQAAVKAVACPSPTLIAVPTTINPGQSSTLMPGMGTGQVGVVDQGVGPVVSGVGAPVSPSATTTYTLEATNEAGSKASASAAVTVQKLAVVVSPASGAICHGDTTPIPFIGDVIHAVNGASTAIVWSATGGVIDQQGVWTPPVANGTYLVTATSLADGAAYAKALMTVQDCVNISVSPAVATLQEGASLLLTPTVEGTANTAVLWECDGGTVAPDGTYTAPPGPGQAGTYKVTARSVANPNQAASAIITVTPMGKGISLTPTTVALNHGATQSFSVVVTGLTNSSVTWQTTAGTIDASGLFTVPASGGTGATVTATAVGDNTLVATAAVTFNPISVQITPSASTVLQGATTQFTASVSGTTDPSFTFTVDGIPGGNASVGTISAGGVYTAPTAGSGNHTVVAAATADPTKSASATVTVNIPVSVAVSPTSVTLDHGATHAFSATVGGTTSDSTVSWATTAGSIGADGVFTAPANRSGPIILTARSNADTTKTATATVTLNPVTISLTPSSATVIQGATQSFTATIGGAVNTSATWSVDGVAGGNAAVGTISASGLYTAPAASTGSHTVRAVSVSDPSKTASASILVNAPLGVTVTPGNATMDHGASTTFSAAVTGTTGDQTVAWSASAGIINPLTGAFTAPAAGAGPVTITATANQDGTTKGTANIVLNPVVILVSPSSPVLLNGGTQAFSTAVSGAVDTSVTWSVDGVPGGNATVGTVNTSGVYMAPGSGAGTHAVTATSVSDPARSGSATVTVNQPVVITVSPGSVSLDHGGTQLFAATVTGTIASTAVTWETTAGTISAAGVLTAPTSSSATTLVVTARSVADPSQTGTASVSLNPMGITLLPATASVSVGNSVVFSATVTGAANRSVVYYVDGTLWGDAAVGTIAPNGTYTAPGSTGSHTITAASVADSTQTASAAVTVTGVAAPSVVVDPPDTVCEGGSHSFTASVSGLGSTAVTWTILQVNGAPPVGDPAVEGSMDPTTGIYTFPGKGNTDLQLTAQATSLADGSYSGVRTVRVLDGTLWDGTSPDWLSVQIGSSRLLSNWVWADAPAGAAITRSASSGSILVSGTDSYWQAPAVPGGYVLTTTLNLGAGGCDRVLTFPVAVAEVPAVQAWGGSVQDLGDVDVWSTFGANTKAFTASTSIVSWMIQPDLGEELRL